MHLKSVEIFCEVVRQKSFSKAAAAHAVSQSSASQAVQLLEERLDSLLIDRSKRPLELTPAGQVYYDGCRELLAQYRAVEDRVRQMRDKVVGTVRVAAIYSVGLLQMDRYVRRFEELYPDSAVRVEYRHPDEVYAELLGDRADLGLVSFPRDRGEIVSVPWRKQPLGLVMHPGHPLADCETVGVEELDGADFVAFTRELTIRRELDRWLKRARVNVNVVCEFDNVENIKRAIEVGSGIAVLPLTSVADEVASGALRVARFSDVEWFRPLGIVHKRQALTSAVQKFIDLLHHEDLADVDTPTSAVVRAAAANGHPRPKPTAAQFPGSHRKKRREPAGRPSDGS